MVMITRGGTIPGGMLAESMGMTHILTAAVDFPATALATKQNMLMAWPEFIQFPADDNVAKQAFEALEKLEFGDVVSDQKAKHAEFEVEEPQAGSKDAKALRVVAKKGEA